jgi:hypothetical protein
MTNGGPDLNVATEPQKALAVALIALTGAIFAGAVVFLTLLSGLTHNGAFYATVIGNAIFVFLGLSMLFGGRGYAYGPKRSDFWNRFNLQAVFGAIALVLFIALVWTIYATMDPSPNEKLAAKETELETRVTDVKSGLDTMSHDAAILRSDAAVLKRELAELGDKMNGAGASLAVIKDKEGAFEASVGGELSYIDKSIQSLSQRIEKLEAAPTKP